MSRARSASPASSKVRRTRLKVASARATCWGSTWRAFDVASERSGTTATNSSPPSSGRRTARTAPRTRVAATSPPTTEAVAFSGCPSTRAATPSGSLDPAAAAAAAARAADEPSPRATGISERTVMARRSCPATSMATRAARWLASASSSAPSPSARTIRRRAGSTSTSTYRSRARARTSKPGPRFAADAGARARTLLRVPPGPATGLSGALVQRQGEAGGCLDLAHRLGLVREDLDGEGVRARGVCRLGSPRENALLELEALGQGLAPLPGVGHGSTRGGEGEGVRGSPRGRCRRQLRLGGGNDRSVRVGRRAEEERIREDVGCPEVVVVLAHVPDARVGSVTGDGSARERRARDGEDVHQGAVAGAAVGHVVVEAAVGVDQERIAAG